MEEENKTEVVKMNNGKLILNATFIASVLLKHNKYKYSFKKNCNLTISRDVQNTPELGDVVCIKITYSCDGISNVQYFSPFEYVKAAVEFRDRILSNDPSLFITTGDTLENIKESNEQVQEEISSKDVLAHDINQDNVYKSLCVNGYFAYNYDDFCYINIRVHERDDRKLLITFVNQISEEVYTHFMPIECFNFSIDVFLKLLKTNEVALHINSNRH